MNRQQANLKILSLLHKAVVDFPDQRFGQLLRNLDIVQTSESIDGEPIWHNCFNDESEQILVRLEDSIMGKLLLGIKK